jgi:hypothetical protein
MKQTAVEWLFEKLWNTGKDKFTWYAILKKAKAMEKEQIIDSYCQGCFDISKDENIFPRETSEQYYKETFNKSINNKG